MSSTSSLRPRRSTRRRNGSALSQEDEGHHGEPGARPNAAELAVEGAAAEPPPPQQQHPRPPPPPPRRPPPPPVPASSTRNPTVPLQIPPPLSPRHFPPPTSPQQQQQQQQMRYETTAAVQTEEEADGPLPQASWTLRVQSLHSNATISIHISHDMTPLRLQQCLHQILMEDRLMLFGGGSCDDVDVVGLFRWHDGLFVSLDCILSSPETSRKTQWSLSPPRPPPPPRPFWRTTEFLMALALLLAWLTWRYGAFLWQRSVQLGRDGWELVMDVPLQEFYRHGPTFLGGWEGASLSAICAQITYHGDRHFWENNMNECRRIYEAKQEAAMRVLRPLVYAAWLGVVYVCVSSWLREYYWRRREEARPNRDMVETYQAFNLLTRQLKRAMHQHQQPVVQPQHQRQARR